MATTRTFSSGHKDVLLTQMWFNNRLSCCHVTATTQHVPHSNVCFQLFCRCVLLTFQTLLGAWGQIPWLQLIMEELDDGEGETLVVCHGDGGSDLSVVTEGERPWGSSSRRGSQLLLKRNVTFVAWIRCNGDLLLSCYHTQLATPV